MKPNRYIDLFKHFFMMLMAVLVLAGCSKSDDDDDYLYDDDDDATLYEYNLKFSDFQRSWKLVTFIDEDGKSTDLNYSFTVKDLSKCEELVTTTQDLPESNLQIVVKNYENAVIFNSPANTECGETQIGVIKKNSDPLSIGKIYSFVLSCLTETDEGITSTIDVFTCADPKLEGDVLKCHGVFGHTILDIYSPSSFQKSGTFIFEKQ